VIVRDYEPRDREACRALFAELVEIHRELYSDAQIGAEFVLEGRIFVAEDEKRVVGYAGLLRHGRLVELEPIVVAQEERGSGVGRALAERVVEEARATGAVRVFVRPAARNRDAVAFFHELGFDTLGYVQLQIDLEPRERHAGERIAGREFKA
jgi:N-acetylglutamate synthase-like GNAT family acetyltransferase